VILCQGKIFYDLMKARAEREAGSVALIRVEQLYPFPAEQLRAELEPYAGADVVWVQEEPENMGAWRFVGEQLEERLGVRARGVTRGEGAAPATGSMALHRLEQDDLLERAFS